MPAEELKAEFERLYHATYRYAKGYTLSRIRALSDTDDLLQVVYAALYRRMLSKGTLDETAARKLLTTSIKHELTRYYGYRRREREEIRLEDCEGDRLERELGDSAPGLSAADRQTLEEVWSYIDGKGDLVRRLFLLHFQMGYTLRECAQLLKIGESAATARIYRTLRELRAQYAAPGEEVRDI